MSVRVAAGRDRLQRSEVRRLALALFLVACDRPELIVDVHTDLSPGIEVDSIVLDVSGAGSETVVVRAGDATLDPGIRMPPVAIDPGRRRFSVRLFRDGSPEPVISRSVSFDLRGTAFVNLWLMRSCLQVTCPPPTDPSLTECERATCIAPECTGDGCASPECMVDGDCERGSLPACVQTSCREGRCLAVASDLACGPSEACDPSLGCRGTAPMDAGVDGGTDAGLDGGTDTAADTRPAYTLYRLPPGGTAWETVPSLTAGPTQPVVAAFADPVSRELVALTATDVHFFSVDSQRWVGSTTRAAAFPMLEGTTLMEMEHVVGLAPQRLSCLTREGAWELDWLPVEERATGTTFTPIEMYPDAWRGPRAPPYWDVLAMIGRPSDPENWVDETEGAGCGGAPVSGPHFTYFSWDGFGPAALVISTQDLACFEFAAQELADTYAPLGYPGAPDRWSITAGTELDGTYLFAD